jgi:hypothetical protein
MKNIYIVLLLATFWLSHAQVSYDRTWGTYFYSVDVDAVHSVIDSQGNIIVAGNISPQQQLSYYSGFTTPGCHQPNVIGNGYNGFIAKFSGSGSLLWSTYYGGAVTRIRDIALDSSDNIYVGGSTVSTDHIATPGSFLSTNDSGAGRGFLSKFSPSGQLQWGTYFPSYIFAICTDYNDAIYVTGDNDNDLPQSGVATSGAWLSIQQNYTDPVSSDYNERNAFIDKFDSLGNRLAGTFIGLVYGDSHGYKITCDAFGDVYVCNTVTSNSAPPGFFASPGSHQQNPGGSIDTILCKFNAALSQRLWSTYYGGSSYDRCEGLTTDGDNLYVAGYSSSSNNIATPGSYQSALNGPMDGMLLKFNLAGQRQWATYYGGENYDFLESVKIRNGKIYLSGLTSSGTSISSPGAWQQNLNGGDTFMATFDSNGSREWGSYYGGNKSDTQSNILVLEDNSIFITGITNSDSGISTPGSAQPDFNVGNFTGSAIPHNIFIARFDNIGLGVDHFERDDLKLYPNPNSGSFFIDGSPEYLDGKIDVVIYDNIGREIEKSTIDARVHGATEFHTQVPAGIYLMKFILENGRIKTFKISVE